MSDDAPIERVSTPRGDRRGARARASRTAAVALVVSTLAACAGGESASTYEHGIVTDIRLGRCASTPAVATAAVWVPNCSDDTVTRLDPATNDVVRLTELQGTPIAAAVGDGSVWIAFNGYLEGDPLADLPGGIARIDPASGEVLDRWEIEGVDAPVAYGARAVWTADYWTLLRIDSHDRRVTDSIPLADERVDADPWAHALVVDHGSVWVVDSSNDALVRVDTATRRIAATIHVPRQPFGVAVGAGDVWVTSYEGGTVSRIDPATNRVVARIPVGEAPNGIAFGGGSVWVACQTCDAIQRIDPRRNSVVGEIPVREIPDSVVVGAGSLWVTYDSGDGDFETLTRVDLAGALRR